MLGCHDFCGHYDWTFAWLRKQQGQQAVIDLWKDAIGGESQDHYRVAGKARGMRGLYDTWTATGVDEKCDWTFTLNEDETLMHWDMRQCPSKGFLINNDLVNDEDYCDHCMGWMQPLLDDLGIDVLVHEHNHAGQCWGEMAVRGSNPRPAENYPDIRQDERWGQGFIDRWENNIKLPVLGETSPSPDSCDAIEAWFSRFQDVLVIGRGESAKHDPSLRDVNRFTGVIVADPTYATMDVYAAQPAAVMMGDRSTDETLQAVAKRFAATPEDERPLLLCPFLPRAHWPRWRDLGLPRPVPVLPILLRHEIYRHEPGHAYPTTGTFMVMLAAALNKPARAVGMDLYQPPESGDDEPVFAEADPVLGGRKYKPIASPHAFPAEVEHLSRAMQAADGKLKIQGAAASWVG